MKVAIVTAFPENPAAPHGGVEAVSVNLVRALARFPDLDLHVITIDSGRSAVGTSSWSGVTVHRLPQLQKRTLSNAVGAGRRQVAAYLQDLRADVVHAHDNYGLMTMGLPMPRVFTVHGFIHVDTRMDGGWKNRLRARVWWWYEKRNWAEQPHIVSISPFVRERLGGIATGVIHDIENPVDDTFFGIDRHERRGVIFCAAHLSRLKNTLGLIEGFARLVARGSAAELRLAGGPTDEEYGRLVRERIHRLGLEKSVVLLDKIPMQAIREELSSAAVFALVSLQENSPMGIVEAMAVGVPVVTSNRCGMPYMVRDGETGYLVDPNNPEDIADRLQQILGNDALRAAMGTKAKQIAQERFHPDAVARRTREVYLRAVRDRRRGDGRHSR